MSVVGSVFEKPLDDDVYGLQNALAIIVNGDTAPSALSQGKYIYLINHSTIRSGLYKIISAISSGDTIVSTDIETVPDGIINGLIEADGAKIDKTDIVNNLTTNDSTKVLSAAQGYALNSNLANKADFSRTNVSLDIYDYNTDTGKDVTAFRIHLGGFNIYFATVNQTLTLSTMLQLRGFRGWVLGGYVTNQAGGTATSKASFIQKDVADRVYFRPNIVANNENVNIECYFFTYDY